MRSVPQEFRVNVSCSVCVGQFFRTGVCERLVFVDFYTSELYVSTSGDRGGFREQSSVSAGFL